MDDIEPEEIVSVSVQSSESSSQRVVPLRQRFSLLGGGQRQRPKLVINRDRLTRPTISNAGVTPAGTTTTTTTRRPIINRSRSESLKVLTSHADHGTKSTILLQA